MLKTPEKSRLSHTNATFKALNNAFIPELQDLALKQGHLLEHRIDKYQIWALNHSLSPTVLEMVFNIQLAEPTAKMLDEAARELIKNAGNKEPINLIMLQDAGLFAALAPSDRLRAVALLEQLKVNPFSLPVLFLMNPGLMLSVTGTVIMLTTIGYYSGWSVYGFNSLQTPEKLTVENFPAGWKQAGYPGPSNGYHCFRGYLIDEFTE